MQLVGNTVLITGGTSGIGLELARQLVARGNTVIVTGRCQAELEAVRLQLPELVTVHSDVRDPAAIAHLHRMVVGRYPQLNVLVNNAGIMRKMDLRTRGPELGDITGEIDTNLSGTIRMVVQFLPHLRRQPRAAIINVSSASAFVPSPISPVYSATKAGLHAFTRTLRLQLRGTPVQVFELAPPLTDTPMLDGADRDDYAGVCPMSAREVVERALDGLQRDRLEIRPGLSNLLKLAGRIAPDFVLRRLAGPGKEAAE
jgi:uncharacterized oxidoreductase